MIFSHIFLIILFLQVNKISIMSIIWCKNRKSLTSVVMQSHTRDHFYLSGKQLLPERLGWRLSVSPKAMLLASRWGNCEGNWFLAAAIPTESFTSSGAWKSQALGPGGRCGCISPHHRTGPGRLFTREMLTVEWSFFLTFFGNTPNTQPSSHCVTNGIILVLYVAWKESHNNLKFSRTFFQLSLEERNSHTRNCKPLPM